MPPRKFHGISDVQKSIAEIWMRRKQLFMDFAGTQNQRDKTSAGRFAGQAPQTWKVCVKRAVEGVWESNGQEKESGINIDGMPAE